MKRHNSSKLKWQLLSVTIDLLSLNLAIILAFLIRFFGRIPQFNFGAYLDIAAYITIIFAIIYYIHDLYDVERYFDWSGTVARILQSNFIGFLVVISLSFILRAFAFPRSVFVISYFTATLLVVLSRFVLSRAFYLELPLERILVLGSPPLVRKIEEEINRKGHLGMVHAGTVEIEDSIGEDEVLKRLESKLSGTKIDRLIVATTVHSRYFIFKLSEFLPPDVRLQLVPDIYESLLGRLNFETLSDIPLLDVGKPPDTAWTRFGKRFFDIIFSSSG